jgi:hypothetical protein
MAQFVQIDAEELSKLRPALQIFERVSHASYSEFPSYAVYGFTTDPGLCEHASEIVNDYYADDEEAQAKVNLTAIAVAIPVSADELYYLTGSGLKADVQEFAYSSGGVEGVRTLNFKDSQWQQSAPKMTAEMFSQLALADGDSYLDEFYTQHAKAVPQSAEVGRTEEAVNDQEPVVPAPAPEPKMSSGDVNLQSLIDAFLR